MEKRRRAYLAPCICILALAIRPLLATQQPATYRAREKIKIAPGATLHVVASGLDAFRGVTLVGVGRVIELQFDARDDEESFVALEPWKNPETSAVVLLVGDTRVAPKALIGTPSKEGVVTVDSLSPMASTGRGLWFAFLRLRPKLLLLFDVPREIADRPTTLVVDIGLNGKPTPMRIEITK